MTDYRQKEAETDVINNQVWKVGSQEGQISSENPNRGRGWTTSEIPKFNSKITTSFVPEFEYSSDGRPFEGDIYKSRTVQFWDMTDPNLAKQKNIEPGYYITLSPVTQDELNNPSLLIPYKQEFIKKVSNHPEFSDYTPVFTFNFVGYTKNQQAMVWEALPHKF